MMTTEELCAAFEHCDAARYFDFYSAVRELTENYAMTATEYRNRVYSLLTAAEKGRLLNMARVKGGFADDD